MDNSRLTETQQQIDRYETIRTAIMLAYSPSFIGFASYIVTFSHLKTIIHMLIFIGLINMGVGFVFVLFDFFDKKIAKVMMQSGIDVEERKVLCGKIKEATGLSCTYIPDVLSFSKKMEFDEATKVVQFIESQGFEVLEVWYQDSIYIK